MADAPDSRSFHSKQRAMDAEDASTAADRLVIRLRIGGVCTPPITRSMLVEKETLFLSGLLDSQEGSRRTDNSPQFEFRHKSSPF